MPCCTPLRVAGFVDRDGERVGIGAAHRFVHRLHRRGEVVGRSRDLIISGGENVYPAEIEDLLLAIEGVAEAAVVGVPDEHWGEVPAAFVVRALDTSHAADPTVLDEASIAAAFDDKLARFKHPKRIVFIDRLPRNAMGKVQLNLLRERLLESEAKA